MSYLAGLSGNSCGVSSAPYGSLGVLMTVSIEQGEGKVGKSDPPRIKYGGGDEIIARVQYVVCLLKVEVKIQA